MKGKGFNGKIVVTLLIASLLGLAVSLLVAAVGGYLVEAETVGQSAENGFVVTALLLGSLAAAMVAVKKGQGARIVLSLAGAGTYFLLLLCCGALVFDGIRSGVGMTALVVLCAGLVVWIFGLKGNKKTKYRLPKL